MSNNTNSSIKLTDHARKRAIQKDISFTEMSVVYQYGTKTRSLKLNCKRRHKRKYASGGDSQWKTTGSANGHNCLYIVMRNNDFDKLKDSCNSKMYKKLEKRIKHIVLVYSVATNTIVTTYRSYDLTG